MKHTYIHPEVCLIKAKTTMLAGSYTEHGTVSSTVGEHTDANGNKSIVMAKPYNAWDDDDLSAGEIQSPQW